LAFAKANQDIQIVLRPHPFLWGTLTDRKVITVSELDAWRKSWNELPNTSVDEDGSYAELFLATDLLVTDGISFLGEYPLITNKPTIFFENEGHWPFTAIGELAAATSIKVATFSELEGAIASARANGLPDKTKEIEQLAKAASPYPGEAAARILEQVYLDFAGANGPTTLINTGELTELPWELVPGREPFED
jgi:CDP-glycerol glycerophosphotransferase (TagB/SpsB family)